MDIREINFRTTALTFSQNGSMRGHLCSLAFSLRNPRNLLSPIPSHTYMKTNIDRFRLLFCHGLGCAKRNSISQIIQKWAASKPQVDFKSLAYKNYGIEEHIWDINDWMKDIEREFASNSTSKTILVANSAASQALLRAIVHSQHQKDTNLQKMLKGVLMISPGVGMEVENYMERILPGSLEKLKSGEVVRHPSADPAIQINVNMSCLEEFVNNCILRQPIQSIPLMCPVRIIHGLRDKLVPYENSLSLLKKIPCPKKAAYLINDGHFITDENTIGYALDSLLLASGLAGEEKAGN